ncbi:MAG: hypothetical protein ACJ76H_13165 [Bacteriovoracaceae bacterium]
MKFILLLIFVPFLSHAVVPPLSCENVSLDTSKSSREQLQSYYCELNLRCTVNALNQVSINWDNVDARRSYSLKNNCNDELKLAAMMIEISKDPPDIHVRSGKEINESDRQAGKDLPVVSNGPSESSSRVQKQ